MLLLNTTSHSANRWKPFRTEPACQPTNFMDLLHSHPASAELDFLRDRTIVLMGDSVDRDHNDHVCGFIGGNLTFVNHDHPASPPPPPGIAPGGGNAQSRPYTCHLASHNLRIVSIFHYGFRQAHQEGEWLLGSDHFYEPSVPEDRFDLIARPLLRALSGQAVPDLFSFTTGFWDIMRQVFDDDRTYAQLVERGTATEADMSRLDAWSELSEDRLDWYAAHFERFVKKVVETWPGDKPRFLWRGLHRPKPFRNAPVHRVQAVDQLGRSIVERLIRDDKQARSKLAAMDDEEAGASGALGQWFSKRRLGGEEEQDDELTRARKNRQLERARLEHQVLGQTPLGERMVVNPWGQLIAGQERHFKDGQSSRRRFVQFFG